MTKFGKRTSVAPSTVTKYSEGAVKPTKKTRKGETGKSRNSEVTTTKANPEALAEAKRIASQFQNTTLKYNKDGSVEVHTKK